jgi:hypothetical protein
VASGANANNVVNTRQIVFISPPSVKDQTNPRNGIKTSDGQWYDPWGTSYRIRIDGTYDNQIANPYSSSANAGPTTLSLGAIAWSFGKDQQQDSDVKAGDDVLSWQ